MADTAPKLWVRVRTLNERAGHVTQRYMVWGHRFEHGRGWYIVSATWKRNNPHTGEPEEMNAREYLEGVTNDNENEDSPPVFHVVGSKAEADAIDEAEKRAKERKRPTSNPIDLSTPNGAREAATRRGRGRPRKSAGDDVEIERVEPL